MESTDVVGEVTAVVNGKYSDLSLLEQFRQTSSDSSEMDDSELEDAVQTGLGNSALEDSFELKGVSRWPVCFLESVGLRKDTL